MRTKNLLLPKSLLTLTLLLSTSTVFADINIDGDISDWKVLDRINPATDIPPALDNTDAVYGKYITSPESAYVFAIKTNGTPIGANTTFWLNTDDDVNTGFQVWGSYGGAEFFVNIYSGDNKPYLYGADGAYITGPLEYSYNTDNTILEVVLPASYINNPQHEVGIIGDINDQIFFPQNYSLGQPTISNEPLYLPPRTDFSKRVGIVYSQTSRDHFYDINLPVQKAYSQIFMTTQYHSMMAGVPFDLLSEDDLSDISKLVNYDTLIFPNFSYVPTDKLESINKTLYKAVYHYGIGIITAGDWMTSKGDGSAISGDSYRNMKQMLGIGRVDGNGPVSITLRADDIYHPIMRSYEIDETILKYDYNRWYSYFAPVSNGTDTQPVTVLAKQSVAGSNSGTYSAVISTETGGRNVHFSSLEFIGDSNLLWSAIAWSVFGEDTPISLKMGRFNNLFVSRNDVDQSQEIDEVAANSGALLDILKSWKKRYNFVGSYYINIGDNPPNQYTDWSYSGPLYRKYIDLGNEIGTHSYTHPSDTNLLAANETEFEFKESMDIIASNLNPTWRDQNIRGGAVPGAPDSLVTAEKIMPYLDYLSGGYSGIGAGYPGAFGYLTPFSNKVYLSPNMTFDFTLIEYGIPVWDEYIGAYVPRVLTPADAREYWRGEYRDITKHASLPIIHWPWHDYGPTTGVTSGDYSRSMFRSVVKTAYYDNAEFLTGIDLAQRIETFKNAKITINDDGDTIDISVDSQNVGKFAVELGLESDEKIISVDNWYAYNDKKVFLDKDGGDYRVNIGTQIERKTHIKNLPMRANLLSLNGNGSELEFSFEGEGVVELALAKSKRYYTITGADRVENCRRGQKGLKSRMGRMSRSSNAIKLTFNNYGVHTVTIKER